MINQSQSQFQLKLIIKEEPSYMLLMKLINNFSRQSVKVLQTSCNNIYLNLAVEEYLFEKAELTKPTLFLWRNNSTIVIGRHQNPWKQCKNQEMKVANVLLSRRKTGGGAVYQDLGNTCFSFLTPYSKDKAYDYKTVNNQIMLNTYHSLGVPAEVSGRNDITVNGKKISGSAYRLSLGGKDGVGRKALHHGTVLFSIDLEALQKYLNPNKKKLESKGVDSVISRVMNLNETYPRLNHDIFCSQLEKQFALHYNSNIEKEVLDYQQVIQRNGLVNQNYERLKSWEWLYGQCPEFKYSIEKKFDWGLTEVTFNVVDGYIKEAKVYSDCLFPDFITLVNEQVINQIKYDQAGLQLLENNLILKSDAIYHPFVRELCEWMIKSL